MAVEIINAFKFEIEDDTSYIFELKKLTVPETYPKSERYQWVLHNQSETTLLKFSNRDHEIRVFADGTMLDLSLKKIVQQGKVRKIEDLDDLELLALGEFVDERAW